MGIAILWIFFYHTGVSIPGLHAIFSTGWIGVEIFFLVSGFGCCASLSKNPSVSAFYKRRAVRILPTWLVILLVMHIVGLRIGANCPHTLWEGVQWYTGLGWWIDGMYFEWYIPTLILFYIFSPLFFRMNEKQLLFGMVIAIVAGFLFQYIGILDHVYMSYQRIPVFMLGFWAFKALSRGGGGYQLLPVCVLALFGFILFVWGYTMKEADLILSLSVRRYSCLLFLVPLLKIFSVFFDKMKFLVAPFVLLGTISMEVYLLHINHDYSSCVTGYLGGFVPQSIVSLTWFCLVVLVGWALHWVIGKFITLIREK